tara:strand:- start:3954 stop:4619 length:666 start_codon:yes stop_codon:yes gene_type:complete
MKIINVLLPVIGCLIGFIIAFNYKPKNTKLILAFSGAFLISLIVSDILPVLYIKSSFTPGPWIMIGILLQIILEFFSKGAEHGHSHLKTNQSQSNIILISICLHSFLEGLPINKFETLSWGLFIHKIPVAMVVFFIFNKIKKSVKYNLLCLSIFSISTPLGAIVSYSFPVFENIMYPLTALVVGMLLHIGTTILFESSEGHKFNIQKIVSIVLAIIIAAII